MLYMAMEFDLLFDVAMEFDQNRSPQKILQVIPPPL